MVKVCHMTSAHSSNDVRIFYKECASLSNAGYKVYLVAHGESRYEKGVQVAGIGDKPESRLNRMLLSTRKVYKRALALNCDIYHIHDPELLAYGLKLAHAGKKVIFDSHEDYLSTMDCKEYIPKAFRKVLKKVYKIYERSICKQFTAIISCYHWSHRRFSKYCKHTKMIFNYPIIKEDFNERESENNKDAYSQICYVGGIDFQWNIDIIVKGLEYVKNIKCLLAGSVVKNYMKDLNKLPGWKRVAYLGKVPYEELPIEVYKNSFAAAAILDYIPQCKYNIGNLSNTKLFEYMYYELPVICTDFKLWKKIIEEEKCGICVNPNDPKAFAEAVAYLNKNREEARQMGMNGKKAIYKKYNWSTEEKKLLSLYEEIKNENGAKDYNKRMD